jgi:hypothetical protein
MELPDLANLTLTQVFGLLAVTAAFDVLTAIVASIVQGVFSLGAVAIWLQSHVLKRAFPIFALAVLGHGIPVLDVPPIGPAYVVALAGLGAYVMETVASIRGSLDSAARPVDTSPAS